VAEVIQKRLLEKNDAGATYLEKEYQAQSNNFKTLFDFADGSQTYKNFQDQEHFTYCYPFVPYQFTLFQVAIQNLSIHNAFEGRHSSVGERPMLGVFQQVAVQVAEQELGQLATFDLMFEGIRSALKANIQTSILVAERNLDNPFAVKVLKALFLVKYVKEFKATVRNICVLMLDRFDSDLPEDTAEVKEALNLLEQQTYIQRSGPVYEFLTDEEKDVEQEIKNTEVETTDISDELSNIVFDRILKSRKIRHEDSGRDFFYSKRLDDRLIGREYELSIHVITPFNDHIGQEEMLRMQSWGKDELLVMLPADDRLVQDLLMYKRTEKYVRQNISVTQQESIKRILTDKSFQNRERLAEVQARVHDLLSRAKLYTSGDEIEVGNKDPQFRLVEAFSSLILRVYTNLSMLRGIVYKESDVSKWLSETKDSLFDSDVTALSEPEQELLSFIQGNRRNGVRSTLILIVDRFEHKPYGWHLGAILCILAKICARGKIEVRSDSDILEDAGLLNALLNSHGYSNVIVEPQVDFTASQVRRLKTFYEDFFDSPPKGREAKELGKETAASFSALSRELSDLSIKRPQYPFLAALDQPIEKINKVADKPYTFYLTELNEYADSCLDIKDTTLDPIRRFMSGPNQALYREARRYLQIQEPNIAYVEGDEANELSSILSDMQCYKGNKMQQVKKTMDALKTNISNELNEEVKKATGVIDGLNNRLTHMVEFKALRKDQQKAFGRVFENMKNEIETQQLIAVIRDTLRRFEEEEYPRQLLKLETESNAKGEGDEYQTPTDDSQGGVADPPMQFVPARSINTSFSKPWLANESEVDAYLKSLREAFLKVLEEGKRIQV